MRTLMMISQPMTSSDILLIIAIVLAAFVIIGMIGTVIAELVSERNALRKEVEKLKEEKQRKHEDMLLELDKLLIEQKAKRSRK